jgi:hypothetical protein
LVNRRPLFRLCLTGDHIPGRRLGDELGYPFPQVIGQDVSGGDAFMQARGPGRRRLSETTEYPPLTLKPTVSMTNGGEHKTGKAVADA